jgi:hypothetical protein
MRLSPVLIAIIAASGLEAQQPDTASSQEPGIQDNSFLVEEAYNQEAGVVQHISTFQGHRGTSDFDFAFTQEWPIGSIRHQLSYDIPIARIGSRTGIGDVGINYRYQILGDGTTRLAIAPRFSVILPTGDWKRGRGSGGASAEINLPVSYVLSRSIVTHFNLGAAGIPSARNSAGDRAGIFDWSAAQSTIFTASSIIQPMLEIVYSRGSEVVARDRTETAESFFVAPGLRAAINFKSGLQVVPGFSVPLGVGPSDGERGFFLYLSFEHPFKRQR